MSAAYLFGRYAVDPAERQLLADGVPARVGARAFDVLVWLIEHRDRLVTKQEFLEAVWPGLVVEENNLSVQVSALRRILGPGLIATVPGRGFRFTAQVLAKAMPFDGQSPVLASPGRQRSAFADPAFQLDRPAIAVLPFGVFSADPADAFLSDGLVADVTALLARVPGFLMISRASSFAFRERTADIPRVARELGVRYLVEGSLRAQGAAVRVSAQLTDAASGHILWNGEFHSARDDAEDMQTGIARGILSQLQPELTRAEIGLIRRQRPET